jgi:hypothetical protein
MVYDPYTDAINQGAHEQYPPAVKYPASRRAQPGGYFRWGDGPLFQERYVTNLAEGFQPLYCPSPIDELFPLDSPGGPPLYFG